MHAQDFYLNTPPKGDNKPNERDPRAVMISAGQTMFQFFNEMEELAKMAPPEDQKILLELLNQHMDEYYGTD